MYSPEFQCVEMMLRSVMSHTVTASCPLLRLKRPAASITKTLS